MKTLDDIYDKLDEIKLVCETVENRKRRLDMEWRKREQKSYNDMIIDLSNEERR